MQARLAAPCSGDADAFPEIVRAWSPMMLHVARMYVSTERLCSRTPPSMGLHPTHQSALAASADRSWQLLYRPHLPRCARLPKNTDANWDQADPERDLGCNSEPFRASRELAHEADKLRQQSGREAQRRRVPPTSCRQVTWNVRNSGVRFSKISSENTITWFSSRSAGRAARMFSLPTDA
jgi:hypothetical protein